MCFLRLAALDTPGAQPAVHLRSQETGHWPGPHKPTEVSTATGSAERRMMRAIVNWWIFQFSPTWTDAADARDELSNWSSGLGWPMQEGLELPAHKTQASSSAAAPP